MEDRSHPQDHLFYRGLGLRSRMVLLLIILCGNAVGIAAEAPHIVLTHGSLFIGGAEIKAGAIPADLCSVHFPGIPVRIHQGAPGNRYHHVDDVGIAFMRYGRDGEVFEIFITLDAEKRQDHDPKRLYAGEVICNGFGMTAKDMQTWIDAEKVEPIRMGDKWDCYWAQYGKWQVFVDKKSDSFTRLSFQTTTRPDPVGP